MSDQAKGSHQMPSYYSMHELISLMDQPNRASCRRLLEDNQALFRLAPGSTHNHQAWTGGYWDHVVEVMNLWVLLYDALDWTGRLLQLAPEEQFSLADGLPVLFLHDIEKPWRCRLEGEQLVVRPELESKADRKAFVRQKLQEYGIQLSAQQQNALQYVEGVRDQDYTPGSRTMLPLAALCHTCDLLSARVFYGFPLAEDNAWGASRIASGSPAPTPEGR